MRRGPCVHDLSECLCADQHGPTTEKVADNTCRKFRTRRLAHHTRPGQSFVESLTHRKTRLAQGLRKTNCRALSDALREFRIHRCASHKGEATQDDNSLTALKVIMPTTEGPRRRSRRGHYEAGIYRRAYLNCACLDRFSLPGFQSHHVG